MTMTVSPPAEETGRASHQHRRYRWSPFTLLSATVAGVLLLLAVFPLGRLTIGLFWSDGHADFAPFTAALALPDLWQLVWQTVAVVAASSVVSLVVGSMLAWLNERTDSRIGTLTDSMPMIPFLLPPIAGAIGWIFLLAPSAGYINVVLRSLLGWLGVNIDDGPFDVYTWYGLIFVYVIYQVPYVFLLVSAGLRNVDGSLEEQSRVSGVGPLRTMWKVTLPAVRPSLGAALVLLFWNGFGLYSVPAVIGPAAHIEVLAVKIVQLLSFTYPPETDAALGLSVIVVVFVGSAWYLQNRLARLGRHARIGGKAVPSRRIAFGPWRWAVRLVTCGYLAIGTVFPIVALVLVSLNGFWTPKIRWSNLSFDALWGAVSGDSASGDSLLNSLSLGALGATVGIVLAAILSLFLATRTSFIARLVDGFVKMPAAVSHIVMGLGFIAAYAAAPFRLGGTLTILFLAYLVLWMPQGLVATDAAIGGVSAELAEASHVAGGGNARTFGRIYLPLILSGLATGWALLFVRMVGDLTASSLLSGTTNTVVGFRILEIFQAGSYAELASLSLVLVLITGVVVVLVLAFARRRVRTGMIQPT